MRVDGLEHRIELPDGGVLYVGVRGHYRIADSEIESTLIGAHIKFEATGHGRAHLVGHGVYSLNGGPRLPWH